MRMMNRTFMFLLFFVFPSGYSLQIECSERRKFLGSSFIRTTTTAAAAATFLRPWIASASLLDDFGTDPTRIQEKEKQQAEYIATPKPESTIEPNLRSNYYYPTNKVRYLPRIKRCSDAIPIAAEAIGNGDWDAIQEFAIKIGDDTVLPMKLYTSSLVGGGTNVKVAYAKDMNVCADKFETYEKNLLVAIKKKDLSASSLALEGMASSLAKYRELGNLTGPDGGGDIPSVDEIRRAASRTTGRFYEKAVKERDARVKGAPE
jgi:hypothetical protein